MELRIELDALLALRGIRQVPASVTAAVEGALARGAQDMARSARRLAGEHDYLGTLKQSIRVEPVAELHYRVVAGANYARAVEEGTGPAVGRPAYMPNSANLVDYVRRRSLRGGMKLKKSGTAARQSQEAQFEARAYGLARYIHQHGTKPHPFMAPALAENENRIRALVKGAVARGLQESFGG